MNIVKSLHSSLLYKCFSHREKHYFSVSVLWGFDLLTGKPVLEQDVWQNIGDSVGNGELFDTGMPKPNAELLVSGSCFAPAGKTINASKVSVSLGSVSKELMVFGDRHWIKGMGVGWGVSDPEPFTEMAVSYTGAYGGKDYAPNPLGKGIHEIEGETGPVTPLPNIEYGSQLIGSPKDKPNPASFSRTDMLCQQRMSYAGTYDQKYIETRMPGFPDDLDYRYFNDAAKDQWIEGFFTGDEAYEIRNMNPDHAVISGKLPAVYGRAFVKHVVDGQPDVKEIPTKLDTVWFFPAKKLGVLIYRGLLEVKEDDASDITQILIANENIADSPRTTEHYKQELALRTDPQESFKYLMYTAPLIPEGVTCAFKSINNSDAFPLEQLSKQNIDNYTDARQKEFETERLQRLEETKKQLADSGFTEEEIDEVMQKISDMTGKDAEPSPHEKKIKEIIEKAVPGINEDPDNIDYSKVNMKALDELQEYSAALQKEQEEKNKAILNEQIEILKNDIQGPEGEQAAAQLENLLREMELPPKLPRIDVEGMVKQLKDLQEKTDKELLKLKSMGFSDDELKKIQASINLEESEKQLRDNIDQANKSYRDGAHYMEKARSPHEGKEEQVRESLLNAYKSGGQTAYGDYAFVDLSNLDLAGIDLTGAYLEYADLSNTNLTDAKLSKAILAFARLDNTNLTNVDLTEANLGSVLFDGTKVTDADLTDAKLGKSTFARAEFNRCKMAEKQDMFFESKFDHASFIDSDMRKNNFIDSDISGCAFTGSDLSESNFLNPVMENAIFTGANLSGANFVTAHADGSKFDNAVMKNVRFVAGCSLNNTVFNHADIPEANLRDCNLNNAVFDEANISKSDFGGADLRKATFNKAEAKEAQFTKANLEYAVLDQANLFEGSMYKARISSASFYNSNLYNVNFLGCTHGSTDFTGADMNMTIFKDWRP